MDWEIWYELEAANYLSDNGELVADLFFAMEALADSEGVPPSTEYEIDANRYLTTLKKHIVTYRPRHGRQSCDHRLDSACGLSSYCPPISILCHTAKKLTCRPKGRLAPPIPST